MAYTTEQLYRLLPAIYRIRDRERGEPLRALIAVVAEQAAMMEEDIARLYENWFVETCAEWVVPYIGDLLGVRGIHQVDHAAFSHRARVANTLGYRRRKGTAPLLEQLARDTTGWPARVVEYFQLLATTQYTNHRRLHNHRTPDLRATAIVEMLDTPFDTIAHTADLRRIANNRGQHNLMNVGIFLWRLQAYPVVEAPAFPHGEGRFSFSQLGQDIPLFHHPVSEIDLSHLAEEINVPTPIRRQALAAAPVSYYGPNLSLYVHGVPQQMVACNLSGWIHRPPSGRVAVDPALGRIAFAEGEAPDPDAVRVTYHYGFSGEVGGGCYERPVADIDGGVKYYAVEKAEPARDGLQKALDQWRADGRPNAVVEIRDSQVYRESLSLTVRAGHSLEIRAANRHRPVLQLSGPLSITGEAPAEPVQPGGRLTLDGLVIAGNRVEIADGALGALHVSHCTLVPGWALDAMGTPVSPGNASLLVLAGNPGLNVVLTRTISGPLHVPGIDNLTVADSIVDGTGDAAIAAGTLRVAASTVLGPVSARVVAEASNSIFTGRVIAERKQEGCVRFCSLPPNSIVPRQFRCQPTLAIEKALEEALQRTPGLPEPARERIRSDTALAVRPGFTDSRYGRPGYAQLSVHCPVEIRTGADDRAEMGAFHHLQQSQRDANLRASVGEYLRVGLEAGLFYVT